MGSPTPTHARRPDPGLALVAYRALTSLARPAAGLILRARERRGKEDAARLGERLGQPAAARPEGTLVWFHAASVGETNAVLPLIRALLEARPRLSVLLTTGTVTSARLAASRLPARAVHQYVPLDAPEFVRRFLAHWRPALAVFTEQEIWPNLVFESHARAIPLVLVNARMSPSSFERWQRRASLARPLFSRFDFVLAQNDMLAGQFRELGAPFAVALGNLKIDAPALPVNATERQRLETALGNRPRLVAASTHDGEEAIIGEAHRRLARSLDGFITLLAPRHPERGPAIAEMLKAQGFNVAQRSLGALPEARTDIYIADTIGELGTLYAITSVAFIGGSLVPKGGQNPVEAIRHGVAVLTGPNRQNFLDAYDVLFAREAVAEVASADELADRVLRLSSDASELGAMRARAAEALRSMSGALGRTLEVLLGLLPVDGEGLKRAS